MKYDQYAQIDMKPSSSDFQCQNVLLKDSDLEMLKARLRNEVENEYTLKLQQEKNAIFRQQEVERQKFETEKSEQMRQNFLQEQRKMQQVIDEMESQIYDLKSSDARNQNLVMNLNDQMNKLKDDKHQAML